MLLFGLIGLNIITPEICKKLNRPLKVNFMHQVTLNNISPNYTHEKLDASNYTDLVDVFEDRMRNWLLEPALYLLKLEHGAVPAVSLILGYFEGIEIYHSGKDSKSESKKFFRCGFQRVFNINPEYAHMYDELVDGLYVQARCGFAHDGLFRNRVFFSDARKDAFTITWPRKNGEFVKNGHLESVVINSARFIDGVVKHFDKYIALLRSESEFERKANFLAAIELKWGLNEPERVIAMSESDFFSGQNPTDDGL